MFGWVHQDDGFDVPSLDDGDDFSLSDTLDGMGCRLLMMAATARLWSSIARIPLQKLFPQAN
jgi:hypothetical protein